VVNKYLLLAFSALWVIFFLYAWSLSRRQAHLGKELEELKNKAGRGRPSDSRPS
jgi:CcmD family protein